MKQSPLIHVIGGGLAGSEAAWQAARAGIPVMLHEMRPTRMTDAHNTGRLAELVCSNSFRSDDQQANAIGVLHEEMRQCGSLIMRSADGARVPAGSALAVDRDAFSSAVQEAIEASPLITLERGELTGLPPESWGNVIIATGPLTSPALTKAIQGLTGTDTLAFFDAIAPIIYKESIDFSLAWFQSRYDKSDPMGDGADYINCPLDQQDYEAFAKALQAADTMEFRDWEKDTPYFEGCIPIEIMAARGIETLRFGPMKPVGLIDPRTGGRPHAVLQLRQDNALGTLFNMVGFQTKMRHGAQTEVFRMIPGLQNAQFARLGGLHRNTFINSPILLDNTLRLIADPRIRFAGQITGVEGYLESAAIGLLAGRFAAGDAVEITVPPPPHTTALGALLNHITQGADTRNFQPMNVNFGLFAELQPEISCKGKNRRLKGRERKQAMALRALSDITSWADSPIAAD
ncbi:MAG: methylenetetrahydrofolate--tRNA-(uracil(54)-C(5))-methyltransferase (FADH(2)-oxidizing) TrmFO [Rhodospirillaceae bacterium]|nr:methylenetetrahydrofolate--tRNA-(uracil(54)-C(5))-methyltransferase (FADH(2)-oxidizing) TrmFO [Rhodospirillaceae bacterium]